MTSFNVDYEEILMLLQLNEQRQQHDYKIIREILGRLKLKYEQRSQEVGSSNGDTRP
ncbi:MAG: hypothetical protein NTX92_08960 [Euryarchaeota archaeon]|nr:hypothetical protein [Euryarchaeota archaeon]